MNFIKGALAFKSSLTRFNEEEPLGKLSLARIFHKFL